MVLLLVIIVVIGVVFGVGFLKGAHDSIYDFDNTDITYLYYSHGGSSLGDSYRIVLSGKTIDVEKCIGNGSPIIEKRYRASLEVYLAIEDIVSVNDMKTWVDLPQNEYQALDAPTTYLEIRFKDGTEIDLNSDMQLPQGGWKAVRAIVDELEKRIK